MSLEVELKKYEKLVKTLKASVEKTESDISRLNGELTKLNEQLRATKRPRDRTVLQRRIISTQSSLRALNVALKSRKASLAKATEVYNKLLAVATSVTDAATVGLKRAVLVGINYVDTSYELAGCINDVMNMRTQLRRLYPTLRDIRMLTDDGAIKPSKANILAAIDWLVSDLKAGENVIFHYSGHGGLIRDTNGDEVSGNDSCIYPCTNGTLETMTDDEIRATLAVRIPSGSKCFVVLDACYSGSGVDLRYLWQVTAQDELIYSEDNRHEKTLGDVVFLSGCRDDQTSADTVDSTSRPAGALTWALLETWNTYGPAIKTKYLLRDVRKFLSERGYTQVPQLSTGRYIDLQNVFDLSK